MEGPVVMGFGVGIGPAESAVEPESALRSADTLVTITPRVSYFYISVFSLIDPHTDRNISINWNHPFHSNSLARLLIHFLCILLRMAQSLI